LFKLLIASANFSPSRWPKREEIGCPVVLTAVTAEDVCNDEGAAVKSEGVEASDAGTVMTETLTPDNVGS
jgi:hypothetical protein